MGGSPCSAAGWLPPGTPDLSRSAADERPGGEERRVRGAAPLSRAPCTPASATTAPQPPARVETAGTQQRYDQAAPSSTRIRRRRLYGREASPDARSETP